MRKLLSANFARLWQSKVFWVLEIGAFLFGAFMYFLVRFNVENMGMSWLLENANYYFFFIVLYMGALDAVFSSLFLGTEYSDGTLHNKLSVGHSRRDIYFSNWIINATVTVLFMLTHFLAAVVVGIPAGGIEVLTAVDHLALKAACGLVIALAYTSIFTMTTMLDSNKARCAVVNIVLALALMFTGFMLYSALEQPEFVSRMVEQADGSYLWEGGFPNHRYVSGSLRTAYTVAEAFMPAALALRVVAGRFSLYSVLGCGVLTVLLAVIGAALFKKKDIK